MLASPPEIAAHAHYPAILALILLGAFTKSAQFPFHFWLPNAMAAPTPVSAYLHSATMVKAGVFLLARLNPVLGGTDAWAVTLTAVGAVTAVYSAAVALTRSDIKQVLAYTTVMALGVCVMFIGLPGASGSAEPEAALLAAVGFIFVHALYKAALFMVAGTIDHATGTRNLGTLGGLYKALPWTLAGATLAALAMAGMWPTIGFVAKELLYASALDSPWGALAVAGIFAANLMIAVAALVLLLVPFAGTVRSYRKVPHEASWALRIGPLFLGCCGLLAGLFPGPVFHYLLVPAAAAASGQQLHFEAALWHGFNLPLALSLATLTLAGLLFWKRSWWLGGLGRAAACLPWTGDRAYDAAMSGIASIAGWQTRLLQGGVQRRYLLIVFAALGAVLAGTIWIKDALALPAAWPQVSFVEWALALLIAAAALVTIWAKSRLLAICALGAVGTGTALVFLVHGAADVAMTQLMVETLVVVIVAMVLLKLPDFRGETAPVGVRAMARRSGRRGGRHLGHASPARRGDPALGSAPDRALRPERGAAGIRAECRQRDPRRFPGPRHAGRDHGAGRRRGGGVHADPLALASGGAPGGPEPERVRTGRGRRGGATVNTLILREATRILVALMLVVSVFMLLRGHNQPGGGFVGGLIASIAFSLHVFVAGAPALRSLLRTDPRWIAAMGLAVALASGFGGAIGGGPFLTSAWTAVGGRQGRDTPAVRSGRLPGGGRGRPDLRPSESRSTNRRSHAQPSARRLTDGTDSRSAGGHPHGLERLLDAEPQLGAVRVRLGLDLACRQPPHFHRRGPGQLAARQGRSRLRARRLGRGGASAHPHRHRDLVQRAVVRLGPRLPRLPAARDRRHGRHAGGRASAGGDHRSRRSRGPGAMTWLLAGPIVLPLATAVVAAIQRGTGRRQVISVIAGLGLLGNSIALLASVWRNGPAATQAGGWPAPFGITLVADHLSAAMVLVTAVIGLATIVYSLADVERRGLASVFHPLLHALLAGVCGAFLAGDIFNLYVWFEVMLIASIGLLVVGGTRAQLDAAIRYAALSLVATTLLLTGIGLLYGLTGTLNLADLHLRVRRCGPAGAADRGRRDLHRGVRHQVGGVPHVLLAPGQLPHAEGGGVGGFSRGC